MIASLLFRLLPVNQCIRKNRSLNRCKSVVFDEGFTILELLIVIVLIIILALIALIIFDPKAQIEKSWDAKRKIELATMQKVFEEFFNDRNHYPTAADICYDDATLDGSTYYCFICGREDTSPDFDPYLTRVPCDPQHPNKEYLLQYDGENPSPYWYKICVMLSDQSYGEGYNWGVGSPNVELEPCLIVSFITPTPGPSPTAGPPTPTSTPGPTSTPTPTLTPTGTPTLTITPGGPTLTPTQTPTPTPTLPPCPPDPQSKFCLKNSICNNCGTFDNCSLPNACNQPLELYSDWNCTARCE